MSITLNDAKDFINPTARLTSSNGFAQTPALRKTCRDPSALPRVRSGALRSHDTQARSARAIPGRHRPGFRGGSRRKYRDFGRAFQESGGWRFRDRIEARIACRGRRRIWRQYHPGCHNRRKAGEAEAPKSLEASPRQPPLLIPMSASTHASVGIVDFYRYCLRSQVRSKSFTPIL
jgi:hypothetical protein